MQVDEFKFRVIDKSTGGKCNFIVKDLYGYEGEICGVLIQDHNRIPNELRNKPINYNSGYVNNGINKNIEIIDINTKDYSTGYDELSKLNKDSLISLILKLKKLNSRLKGRLYRCEDKLDKLEDIDLLMNELPEEFPAKDKDIGGSEIKIGIEFDKSNGKEYFDIVSELSDNIVKVIEELGHTFLISTSKPILKSDLE